MKKWLQQALDCGRSLQSESTGYLHFHPHAKEGEERDCIPIYENFLFALALLRSKQGENVHEAKAFLKRLLSFQKADQGVFPVNLHEYPQCKDASLPLRLMPIFCWILYEFSPVLGEDLKGELKSGLRELAIQGKSFFAACPKLPSDLKLLLGAGLISAGKLFGEEWPDAEKLWKENLHAHKDLHLKTQNLNDSLIALQITGKEEELLKEVLPRWSKEQNCFIGPFFKERFMGRGREAFLLDLFLAGVFDQDISLDWISPQTLLQGALLRSYKGDLGEGFQNSWTGTWEGGKISVSKRGDAVISVLEDPGGLNLSQSPGFFPFSCSWGRDESLLLAPGNLKSQFSWSANELQMDLCLSEEVDTQNREKAQELAIFLTLSEARPILIDDIRATTFRLGDELSFGPQAPKLLIDRVSGEGNFIGHIQRGNRPSQILTKGSRRFEAFDQMVILRTLRREEQCSLRLRWIFP